MNLKDFSLLKEDDNHYTIGHPKGKSLTIPKQGLSDKAHQLIAELKKEQHLAEGTEDAPVGESEPETVDVSAPVQQKIAAEDEIGATQPAEEPPASTAPIVAAPTQAVAAPDTSQGLQKASASIEKGVAAQQKAGQQEAKAQSELISGLSNLKSQDQLLGDYQTRQKALEQKMNQSVDNDRYIHNMSTGSKIASAIGLLLGGFTSGFSGGKNPALESLNNAIEKDVQSQKDDRSNAMNLWKMNREVLGDETQANLATQNQLLTIAKAKMIQAQSGALGAQAQQNAAQGTLQIDQQIAQNNWMRSRLSGSGAPGTEQQHIAEMQVMEQLNPAAHKQMEAKYIPGVGISRVPASAKDRDTFTAYDEMEKALNDAKAWQQEKGGLQSAIPGTELHKIAASKANAIALAQNKLNGIQRLNETEYKAFQSAVDSIGSPRTGAAVAQVDELLNQVARKRSSLKNSLGIIPFRQAPSDKVAIAWARVNPNTPQAAAILQKNGIQIPQMNGTGNQLAGR